MESENKLKILWAFLKCERIYLWQPFRLHPKGDPSTTPQVGALVENLGSPGPSSVLVWGPCWHEQGELGGRLLC